MLLALLEGCNPGGATGSIVASYDRLSGELSHPAPAELGDGALVVRAQVYEHGVRRKAGALERVRRLVHAETLPCVSVKRPVATIAGEAFREETVIVGLSHIGK